jgi:hypothetical protein
MQEKKKCQHPTCTCPAAPLQDYCCEECKVATEREESGEDQMTECRCGHPDCTGEPEVPAETQGLFNASEVLAVG